MPRSSRRLPAPLSWPGLCALASLVAGCAAPAPAPAPAVAVPAAFREGIAWVPAPGQAQALPADWWRACGDSRLDALEAQASNANPTLDAARAVRDQARAAVAESQASLWPTLSLQASSTRRRDATYSTRTRSLDQYVWSHSEYGLDASWEPDVWGQLGDAVKAGRARAQADDAALAGARLGVAALVAATYFDLRQMDADLALRAQVRELVARERAMTEADLTRGRASRDDLRRADIALDDQDVRLALLRRERAASEHALAALLGQPAAGFQLEPSADDRYTDVQAPPTLPSALLARRPDVQRALAAVRAADFDQAAARAAWFPQIMLGGSIGGSIGGAGSRLFQLMQLPVRLWSVGPAVAATLVDGGARQSRLDAAQARRDEAVALYRASVLAAFQEVEDLLSARREALLRDRAAEAVYLQEQALLDGYVKRRAVGLASLRDEMEARREALEARQSWIDGRHETRQTELLLIKAIGGGWEAP
ncbi:MAG: efflux transporter outer membrane subunit [Burkholderiaceae bacterium]